MTVSSQLALKTYKIMYWAIGVSFLNLIFQIISAINKRKLYQMDMLNLFLWTAIPLILILFVYRNKKSTPLKIDIDGVTYSQGIFKRHIPMKNISGILLNEKSLTIEGLDGNKIKEFKIKQYADLELIFNYYNQNKI